MLKTETSNLDIITNDNWIIVFNKNTNTVDMKFRNGTNINIETSGDINIKCKSYNVLVEEDFSVDSLRDESLPSIFLNSKMAKQIRNLFYIKKKGA